MQSGHQIHKEQRVSKEDLDQVVAHNHRQEEYQTELVECQNKQVLLVDEWAEGDVQKLTCKHENRCDFVEANRNSKQDLGNY